MTFTIRASKDGQTVETVRRRPDRNRCQGSRAFQDRLAGADHRQRRIDLRAVRVRPVARVRSPQEAKAKRDFKRRRSEHRGKYPGGAARTVVAGAIAAARLAAGAGAYVSRVPLMQKPAQARHDDEKTPSALDGVKFGRATRDHKRAAANLISRYIAIRPVEVAYPPKSVVSERSKLRPLLRRPMSCLRSFGRSILEATPRRFDLGLGGTVASRPHLGGGFRKPGDVEPDHGTGRAVNKSRTPGSFRARNQHKANGNNAPPT